MTKIEMGLEAFLGAIATAASAVAVTWGAIIHTQVQVAATRDTIELIREDTQYLRDRIDRISDSRS